MADCTPVTSDDEPAAANNPAGRVLAFLREFQATMPQVEDSAMLVLMKMLDEPEESARIYLATTQLRLQEDSVPDLMTPYAGQPGYAGYADHYPQIFDATKRLQAPAGQRAHEIFTSVDNGGWSALRYASDMLGHYAAESSLTTIQEADYLVQVQELLKTVAGDESLSPQDRSRLVDLLRKVEQALLDIKINGALPVQEAAAAAGAIVSMSPTLIEKVRQKPYARDLFTVLYAIVIALQAGDSGIAIGQWVAKALGGG
jgi:hypothetical protein